MDIKDFREKLIEFANSLEEENEEPVPKKETYDRNAFVSFIMEYGRSMYHKEAILPDPDRVCALVSNLLESKIAGPSYVSTRTQDFCIAIAIPIYIENAPVTIARELRIVPEVFTEVSGPEATVLIIDCEKQYLRKAYLGIEEEEWYI